MKRPCLGRPGYRCPRLIDKAGRCDDCQRAVYATRNRNRPPGERQFYGSAEWKRLSRAVVDAAEACATCGTPRHLTKLTGGHRIPIRQRPDLALEPANVIAQCTPCQSRMKQRPDPATWQPWERSPRGPVDDARTPGDARSSPRSSREIPAGSIPTTPHELEAMLSKIVRFRDDLRQQWVQVMRYDDEPIPPELAEIRAAVIRDNDRAEGVEQHIRRAIVRRWAGHALDAGLDGLIARYPARRRRN